MKHEEENKAENSTPNPQQLDINAFLNLLKCDDIIRQEWDYFRYKFDKVVKWFYNHYLNKSLPGPIPPTINGTQVYLLDLYKLIEGLGGYLSVHFGQEFGTIGELIGLSKQDGDELKKCYIKYLDIFTSYYKTARGPNFPTKRVEVDKYITRKRRVVSVEAS
ncbi:bulb-type lectin domain-containing protein [Artemisia annua]|uniref:Bulb-type lectin domain-containing protein n=1 Tax=Artemisia annua TaxID=35608 RepID=A0A2U1KN98_ARTAN|nr:bulb-type lectin domain-containing protein [Artemisia annua]